MIGLLCNLASFGFIVAFGSGAPDTTIAAAVVIHAVFYWAIYNSAGFEGPTLWQVLTDTGEASAAGGKTKSE